MRRLVIILTFVAGCSGDNASAVPTSARLPLFKSAEPLLFAGPVDGATNYQFDIVPVTVRGKTSTESNALLDTVEKSILLYDPAGIKMPISIRRPAPGSYAREASEQATLDVIPSEALKPGWYRLEIVYDSSVLAAAPSPNSTDGRATVLFRVGSNATTTLRQLRKCGAKIVATFSEAVPVEALPMEIIIYDPAKRVCAVTKPTAPSKGAGLVSQVELSCDGGIAESWWSVSASGAAIPTKAAHYRDEVCEYHHFAPAASGG